MHRWELWILFWQDRELERIEHNVTNELEGYRKNFEVIVDHDDWFVFLDDDEPAGMWIAVRKEA